MKAMVVSEPGDPDVLEVEERERPVPGKGEVVVRLEAANVNPTDLQAREGNYPPDKGIEGPPYVLGWDLAGTVAEVGDGVEQFAAGSRVVGMIPWYDAKGEYGAYAEEVLARAEWLVPLPEGLDPALAATVPLNALTAEQALDLLGVSEGDRLLVIGASGAVGSFAVQLAIARGAEVSGVAGSEDDQWVESLGAEVISRDQSLEEIGTFPFVLDSVPVGEGAFAAIADGGTVVSTRPVEADPGREIEQRAMLIHHDPEALARLVGLVADGTLRSRIAETLPLTDAAEAHRRSEEPGHHGKEVLVV
jgi:NADPH:quinone reductase-like Zn-dependent oxidoreductase